MASIVYKANGKVQVRWREGGRRSQQRSREFSTAVEALEFKKTVEPSAYDQMVAEAKRQGTWVDPPFSFEPSDASRPGPAADAEFSLAGYLRRMIDADRELRPTTRHLYLRNLRVHVENTDLGRADIRCVTPEMLSEWWASLDAGVGARRNVHQLVSKALNRAVVVGDIDANPLRRAPEVKRPSRDRKDEVEPLEVSEIEELAEAAAAPRRGGISDMEKRRDRLVILAMAYGGLRAGEVGGLRRQDMVRSGERCQLRLRQQVTRITGQGASKSPLKTRAARRTVSIPCSLWDELQAFVRDHPPTPSLRGFSPSRPRADSTPTRCSSTPSTSGR